MTFQVGDIIRDRWGSWLLWRVVMTCGEEGRYLLAVKVTENEPYHQVGTHDLLRCADYQVEPDPLGFIQRTRGRWSAFLDPERRFALRFTTRRCHGDRD